MINKKVIILPILIALFGCSDDIKEKDDYTAFDDFKVKSKSNQAINCNALASTVIKKERGNWLNKKSYTDNIIDYVSDDGYTFPECSNVTQIITKYCNENVDIVIKRALDGYDNESLFGNGKFCHSVFLKKFKLTNSTYKLPNVNNRFLILNNLGVMIDPKLITGFSFSKKTPYLWFLTVITEEKQYVLYWGDESLWKKAKVELSQMATKHKPGA